MTDHHRQGDQSTEDQDHDLIQGKPALGERKAREITIGKAAYQPTIHLHKF